MCCLVPSLQWDGGAFLGDVKPSGLDIWWSIDCVDACVTECLVEKPSTRSPRARLSGARVCRYPGYKSPTVAPEPFVEWVIGVVHSTGGIIGTHMLLRVPSRDSDSRPWGVTV
jgi:hypothetical protein